jgi:hypothetical protein
VLIALAHVISDIESTEDIRFDFCRFDKKQNNPLFFELLGLFLGFIDHTYYKRIFGSTGVA